jgi:hypothetical protein
MAAPEGTATREAAAGVECCARCGRILGADEPLVVLVHDRHAARTSLAAFGEPPHEAMVLFHERCHIAARRVSAARL